MRLNFDKEIADIYSAFDETLIHNAPNEEMEEPFHPQDMDDHAVSLNPTDNTGRINCFRPTQIEKCRNISPERGQK